MHLFPLLLLLLLHQFHFTYGGELSSLIDAAYVIGLAGCSNRWANVHAWGDRAGLKLTRVHATEFGRVSLNQPPLPVSDVASGSAVTAGQLACTTSHVRAWRDAYARNASHILILEDDVTPTPSLTSQLPRLLRAADSGVKTRNTEWHLIYLRAYATMLSEYPPPAWHLDAPSLTIAEPSWGTAAYILSRAGVRYLLTRVTSYKRPLDVQIERLQLGKDTMGAAPLVALDACAFRNTGSHGCPENIDELSEKAKGECFYSASQAGFARPALEWPRTPGLE